mmetsp:Transcript_21728/g.50041  ORF Transcript_21728/g.50041 Transcript_21728/m.50041 type:complete len:208 (-) Transcript_21728:978-1601(-)
MRELRVEFELTGVVCDRLISSTSRLEGTREARRLLGVNEFIRCMLRLREPLLSAPPSLMKGATNWCSLIFRASCRFLGSMQMSLSITSSASSGMCLFGVSFSSKRAFTFSSAFDGLISFSGLTESLPPKSSTSKHPVAHKSVGMGSKGLEVESSGAMNPGVPHADLTIWPGCVLVERPKSMSTGFLSVSRSTFSGLMSRWLNPRWCM